MAFTLLIDDRGGSLGREAVEAQIYRPLVKLGIPAEIIRLPYGDFAFEGRGPEDSSLNIGIELKRLQDLATSIRSGRLAGHQLPGLTGEHAAFDVAWLVVEGWWKTSAGGQVLTYHGRKLGWRPLKGRLMTSEMQKKLLTYEMRGGLHVRYTNTRDDTLRFIADLFHWWTDKAMDQHTSHIAVHRPLQYAQISDFREVVSRFPGVGLKTSLPVEQRFGGSLQAACNAPVNDWAGITTTDRQGKTRRLGVRTAERIVAFVKGE